MTSQVKESPIPSDSLFTVDLKSSSKVNIGTHAITLEKFFEGNLKTTRWLDIGNGEGLVAMESGLQKYMYI